MAHNLILIKAFLQVEDGGDGDKGGGAGSAGADQALLRPRAPRPHQGTQGQGQMPQEVHR